MIPACLTEEFRRLVPRSVFTTNPCRMQYCTQQIHIIRADGLMKKTANHDVRLKSMDRKKCSSVAETDDNSVNNVSVIKPFAHSFYIFLLMFTFYNFIIFICGCLCVYNGHSQYSI